MVLCRRSSQIALQMAISHHAPPTGSPLEDWLRNIRDVQRLHAEELTAIKDPEQKARPSPRHIFATSLPFPHHLPTIAPPSPHHHPTISPPSPHSLHTISPPSRRCGASSSSTSSSSASTSTRLESCSGDGCSHPPSSALCLGLGLDPPIPTRDPDPAPTPSLPPGRLSHSLAYTPSCTIRSTVG